MVLTEKNLELIRKYKEEFDATMQFSTYSNMFYINSRCEIRKNGFLYDTCEHCDDCNELVRKFAFVVEQARLSGKLVVS